MFQPRNIVHIEQKSDHQYYPALDYLRITLALSVAAFHANLLTGRAFGGLPVQIFFTLSGWLIGGILVRSSHRDLPKFYWHRALRIWPPYCAAVIILLAFGLVKDVITPKWFEFALYKLTLTFNLFGTAQWQQFQFAPMLGQGAPFWSIGAEEQFYLVAPFLITLLPFGRSFVTWLALVLFLLFTPASYNFSAISVGVAAAASNHQFGDWHRTRWGQYLLVLTMIVAIGSFYSPFPQLFDALIGTPIVLLLARPLPRSSLANFLGGISFPLYLNHWLGIWIVSAAFNKILHIEIGIVAKIAMVACSVAIAAILYFLIDVQCKKYRDRWFTTGRGTYAGVFGFMLVLAGIVYGLSMRGQFF